MNSAQKFSFRRVKQSVHLASFRLAHLSAKKTRPHNKSTDYSLSTSRVQKYLPAKTHVENLSKKEISKIYCGKCRDLGILVIPQQEDNFLKACALAFKNKKIVLRDSHLSINTAKVLGKILSKNTHFCALDLSGNLLADQGAISLCKALRYNTALVHLNLSKNHLGPEGMGAICKLLKSHPSVVSLDLSSNRLGSAGASSLQKCLLQNRVLSLLNLAEAGICDEDFSVFSQGLDQNSSLISLNLSGNKLGCIRGLCKVLVNGRLEELNLANNQIGNPGCEQIFLGITEGSTLNSINLSGNKITSEGLSVLIRGFSSSGMISKLKLDNNSLSKNPDLVSLCSIQHLSLANCCLTDEDLDSLLAEFSTKTGLVSLNIAENQFSERGLSSLAQTLIQSSTLQNLNLSKNGIKTVHSLDSNSIHSLISTRGSLQKINLSCNELTNASGFAILDACKSNKGLLKVKLEENQLHPKLISDINSVLMRNQQLAKLNLLPKLRTNVEELKSKLAKKESAKDGERKEQIIRVRMGMIKCRRTARWEDYADEELKQDNLVRKQKKKTQIRYEQVSSTLQSLQLQKKLLGVRQVTELVNLHKKSNRLDQDLSSTKQRVTQLESGQESVLQKTCGEQAQLRKQIEAEEKELKFARQRNQRIKGKLQDLREEENRQPEQIYLATKKLADKIQRKGSQFY